MTTEPSGADLARQALAAYKSTARPGTQPKPRTRLRRADRGTGRDPVGLGALLGRISAEQGWEASLSAGSIVDQWADLCPQFVGRIEPAHYDPERRVLELRPCSPAYAAQLRLLGGQLAKQINDKLGSDVVRAIRPLPVGAITTTPTDRPAVDPAPAASPAPARPRTPPPAGYQAARAAIRPTSSSVDARVVEAMERQAHAMLREPETAFTDAAVARQELEEAAATQNPDPLLASIQAALAYKHAGADKPIRRAFDVA
ncbi:DciA family protein (plasmid) [Streptomyces sp. NBC_00873]|uniref:DciA family protein n=1 Tax=Streptomyces sp. NBC_00873 TaxID=2975852 RepID=UPI0037DC8872|nr:DciA family protein [Streptomyces sp. NBC_00873]